VLTSEQQAIAAAIPGAMFGLVPDAGHLPQLEAPEAVLALFAETLPWLSQQTGLR